MNLYDRVLLDGVKYEGEAWVTRLPIRVDGGYRIDSPDFVHKETGERRTPEGEWSYLFVKEEEVESGLVRVLVEHDQSGYMRARFPNMGDVDAPRIGWANPQENQNAFAFAPFVGRTIGGTSITEDRLILYFEDGGELCFEDEGQQCCEERWMHTDDALSVLVGGRLVFGEIRASGSVARDPEYIYTDEEVEEEETWDTSYRGDSGDYDNVEEAQFLYLQATTGGVTVVNYNRHNGHYSGFDLQIRAR